MSRKTTQQKKQPNLLGVSRQRSIPTFWYYSPRLRLFLLPVAPITSLHENSLIFVSHVGRGPSITVISVGWLGTAAKITLSQK